MNSQKIQSAVESFLSSNQTGEDKAETKMLEAGEVPESTYVELGNAIVVAPKRGRPPEHARLEAATYRIENNPKLGFYLTRSGQIEVPSKVYGEATDIAARVLKGFQNSSGNIGVLLDGLKGSGKTLTSRLICATAIQHLDMPVLIVEDAFVGPDFFNFLQLIQQPTVVLFDEFEKVYSSEAQERMLSLLEGVFSSRKLFVLTCNDPYRVDQHMKNRPGRIRYRVSFGALSKRFVKEYLEDNLKNQDLFPEVAVAAMSFGQNLTFDILSALVREVNDFNEKPSESLKYLNARPYESGISERAMHNIYVRRRGSSEGRLYPVLHPRRKVNPMMLSGMDDDADELISPSPKSFSNSSHIKVENFGNATFSMRLGVAREIGAVSEEEFKERIHKCNELLENLPGVSARFTKGSEEEYELISKIVSDGFVKSKDRTDDVKTAFRTALEFISVNTAVHVVISQLDLTYTDVFEGVYVFQPKNSAADVIMKRIDGRQISGTDLLEGYTRVSKGSLGLDGYDFDAL